MKLSDVKGERTLDVVAEIIEPILDIAMDKEASGLFKRKKIPKGTDPKAYMAQRVKKHLPPLLKNHREDVLAILSSIAGVSVADYTATLNLAKLTVDITDLLTDESFAELFLQAQSPASSGSAQENTEAPEA